MKKRRELNVMTLLCCCCCSNLHTTFFLMCWLAGSPPFGVVEHNVYCRADGVGWSNEKDLPCPPSPASLNPHHVCMASHSWLVGRHGHQLPIGRGCLFFLLMLFSTWGLAYHHLPVYLPTHYHLPFACHTYLHCTQMELNDSFWENAIWDAE